MVENGKGLSQSDGSIGAAAVTPETLRLALDHNYFIVLPDAAGTSFHGFLLRARNANGPMSFRGVFARTNRPYTATTQRVGDLLHLSVRQDPPRPTDTDDAYQRRPEEIADRAWLRYLGEVSDALASAVDRVETDHALVDVGPVKSMVWSRNHRKLCFSRSSPPAGQFRYRLSTHS